MSVAEVNFSFNGLHCLRDFGCIYIANENGRTISPATERDEYEIAGTSGTVLIGARATHKPYNLSGVLVPMKTPKTLQAAQQLARRISAWLKSGRCALTWDYEPMQQHQAEVLDAINWDSKVWIDGGIAITFRVQPFTYDLTPTVTHQNIAAGTSTMPVPVSTVEPCPVSVELTNSGSAAISRIRIATESGQAVELAKGMLLAAGAVLRLEMEPPIGATITADGDATNALRYAVQFDPLTVNGPENLTIEVDGSADVVAITRGCML